MKQPVKISTKAKEHYYWQLVPRSIENNEERLYWIIDFLNREFDNWKPHEWLKTYIELQDVVFGRRLLKKPPKDSKGVQLPCGKASDTEMQLNIIIPRIQRIQQMFFEIMQNIFSDEPLSVPLTAPSTELEYTTSAYPDETMQERFSSSHAVLFTVNFRNYEEKAVYEFLQILKDTPLSLLSRCAECGKYSFNKKKWQRLCSKECTTKFNRYKKTKAKATQSREQHRVITRKKSAGQQQVKSLKTKKAAATSKKKTAKPKRKR